MKNKLLLFAFITAFLMACSSDDETTPVGVEDPVLTDLKEINSYTDGNEMENRKFENNLLRERYFIRENGDVYFEDIYSYNAQNLLIGRNVNVQYEDGSTASVNQVVSYDSLGRIIKIVDNQTFDGNTDNIQTNFTDFDYSMPNTIVATSVTAGLSPSVTKYHLNSEGLVYMKTYDNSQHTVEATFTNGNIVTVSRTTYNSPTDILISTTSNLYDLQTEVKGEYLKIATNQFGTVKANAAIYKSDVSSNSSNYILNSQMNGNTDTTYEYQFNSAGYPTNVKLFDTNGLYLEHQIIYQL